MLTLKQNIVPEQAPQTVVVCANHLSKVEIHQHGTFGSVGTHLEDWFPPGGTFCQVPCHVKGGEGAIFLAEPYRPSLVASFKGTFIPSFLTYRTSKFGVQPRQRRPKHHGRQGPRAPLPRQQVFGFRGGEVTLQVLRRKDEGSLKGFEW